MATDKPRITVTLDPDTYNVLRQFSKNKGMTMSMVVSDICDEAKAAFQRINALFVAADALDRDAFKDLSRALNVLETRVANAYEDSVAQMDLIASTKGRKKPGRKTTRKASPQK